MKLLHVDASILGDHSASRQLSAAIVNRLTAANPSVNVIRYDLAAEPISHLTGPEFMAFRGAEPQDAAARESAARNAKALDDFLAADVIVIGAPMYNFGMPSTLKAWFDHVLRAGITFRYSQAGPEGLVTGKKANGKVRFISKSASANTRTYRVDVEAPNPDGSIPDGITAEVAIPLAAVPATRVPRSALTFSLSGELGVRIVDAESKVAFVPVSVVEDQQEFMWIGGVADGARVIVQGQDFVREGQQVEPVEGEAPKTAAR